MTWLFSHNVSKPSGNLEFKDITLNFAKDINSKILIMFNIWMYYKINQLVWYLISMISLKWFSYSNYGNTDCEVFIRDMKLEKFLAKNQMWSNEMIDFANWCAALGRCQKVPKFDFWSQLSTSKIIQIFLIFFIEEYEIMSTF